ncbi:hypothetical protein AAEJ74_02920 [Limnospira fusiformis PMC 851.14]
MLLSRGELRGRAIAGADSWLVWANLWGGAVGWFLEAVDLWGGKVFCFLDSRAIAGADSPWRALVGMPSYWVLRTRGVDLWGCQVIGRSGLLVFSEV